MAGNQSERFSKDVYVLISDDRVSHASEKAKIKSYLLLIIISKK